MLLLDAGSLARAIVPVVTWLASNGGTWATGSTPAFRSLADPLMATLASGTSLTVSSPASTIAPRMCP